MDATNVNHTLAERGKRYGSFKDHAAIAQDLKDVMRGTPGWERLSDAQREALEMIAHKTARILNGDPNYADSWHDIQGYAKLVEETLGEPAAPAPAAPSFSSPAQVAGAAAAMTEASTRPAVAPSGVTVPVTMPAPQGEIASLVPPILPSGLVLPNVGPRAG